MGGSLGAAAVVSLLLLAGCSGDDEATAPSPATDPAAGVPQGTPNAQGAKEPAREPGSPPAGSANHAPNGALSASVVQGGAPLAVDFNLDGADQDRDALSWTFDADGDGAFDDDGSALPADTTFTYTSPGLYEAVFALSDGKTNTAYRVVVNVTGDAAEAVGQAFAGSWTASTPIECLYGFPVPEGTTYLRMDVKPETAGMPFEATFASEVPAAYFQVDFMGDNGFIDTFDGGELGTTVTGEVPAGALRAYFYSCGGGVDVKVEYAALPAATA